MNNQKIEKIGITPFNKFIHITPLDTLPVGDDPKDGEGFIIPPEMAGEPQKKYQYAVVHRIDDASELYRGGRLCAGDCIAVESHLIIEVPLDGKIIYLVPEHAIIFAVK